MLGQVGHERDERLLVNAAPLVEGRDDRRENRAEAACLPPVMGGAL
jgi:hypothetical protein